MQAFLEKHIAPSWIDVLKKEFEKPYMQVLSSFIKQEREGLKPIYPPVDQVFNSLQFCPYDQTKVVLIGQDPYHGPSQAHGLSFSVQKGIPIPPSLRNIYKEIKSDLGLELPSHGCLESWAKRGVLLLNATLTVREGEPKSHFGQGWEAFTDAICQKLFQREKPLVFLLWGKSAQDKAAHILKGNTPHLILKAPHPSPFAAHTGFFGCQHFSKANAFLKNTSQLPVDWAIH